MPASVFSTEVEFTLGHLRLVPLKMDGRELLPGKSYSCSSKQTLAGFVKSEGKAVSFFEILS